MQAGWGLTEEQERQRVEGLRVLARIIARHYWAHPELYSAGTQSGADDRDGGASRQTEEEAMP